MALPCVACGGFQGNPASAGCVAAAATVQTKMAGGSWSEALKAGAIAGASSFAFTHFGAGLEALSIEAFATYGTIGGITGTLQGGNFGNSFLAAGLGSIGGGALSPVLGQVMSAKAASIAAAMIAGGAASAITGGKFANGAVTAAFAAAAAEGASYAAGQNAPNQAGMQECGSSGSCRTLSQREYDKHFGRMLAANDMNDVRACMAGSMAACSAGPSAMKGVLGDFMDWSTLPVRIFNPIARRADGLLDIGKTVQGYLNGQNGTATATAFGTIYGMGVERITGSGAAAAAVGKFVESITQKAWEAEIPNEPQR